MTQGDASHHDDEDADDSVQAMAMAGYTKFLAEGPGAEFDHETNNCMYDMAVAGKRPFENLETYLALYPTKDRDAVRRMILNVREFEKNRRTYTVQPGDTVMVAKDRELPHEGPDSLSEFIPCRLEDAVSAIVVEHDGWWLSFRMPDGTTERVMALGFRDTGRCTTA
ncbi:hypothetical protein [Microvirga tunisiensis]|uniref:Uncharacterized protein n=1 Tax=Microvirga tunisiensis TaxID=2108360 RepID=A0A5N7MCS3_9HYPH|nr:hypothetical protein [Microvirga tunisiensis]MPR06283.1 hypothetical protein [Microvirga tunisiensis]MPR24069.1 hypothetical protein [Microvirga tunisiensis]